MDKNNKKGGEKMAKLLIIDDDPDIVAAMKVILESKNHQVTSAGSGSEGLIKLKADKPDLIILDVMMETTSAGFEIAREIRKNISNKDIPILMMTAIKEKTGFDFKDDAGDEDWLPVDDYAEKPLDSDQLLAKVENLLLKRKQ